MKTMFKYFITLTVLSSWLVSCGDMNSGKSSKQGALSGNAAEKVYVAPGEHDDYYAFISGGFSGQLAVYGLPSGRLFKVIPVFSVDAEKAWGFNEETKPMLNTSHGFIPWDDSHHPDISQTAGELDGRWVFINGNNTPRIAKIDLTTFETTEIIEVPNSAGNHSSSFVTENTEYVVAGTRFSVPFPQRDMPIEEYKGNFKGALTFISVNPEDGGMDIKFQIRMPGFDYDLSHPGRGDSHGWFFFTTYNTEEANSLLEVNASQNDKDFIAAINWKKIEAYVNEGGGKKMPANYAHNVYDDHTHTATSTMKKEVLIVGSGKLAAELTIHSFSKMIKAIENEDFDGDAYGIPILSYESTLAGAVKQPGLGPLHTEFDGKGNAYTTFFISSEVVKWKLGTWEVLDRKPTYYSVGHLMIPGGNSRKPFGQYVVAMNKITKDRYLPTGPEVTQSAQLYDITGDKMELLLDFPTIGEPHYAAGIAADIVAKNSKKFFKLEDNNHAHAVKSEAETKVVRDGNEVHIYLTMIRSHFAPDNIEGIQVGDKVYFHVTNLEQDYDVPHGVSMIGANTSELLIMPGQTETFTWEPKQEGVWPFYCTDFCSALHQEMQGYVRVSAKGSNVPISYTLDGDPVDIE